MKLFRYGIENIKSNRKSWLVVAIVSIPLSLSLAIASWWTPLQWIISAIRAMILAAIFSSSKHNIFWPAWALSWILLWFSLLHGSIYLPYIAIIAWIFMLIFYRTKIIRYLTLIPAAWLEWFLFAVWLTILLSQVPNALWIIMPIHDKIYLNVQEIFLHISETQILPLCTTILWILAILFLKKITPKLPWTMIVAIIGIWVWFLVQRWWIPHMNLLIDNYPKLNFSLWQFWYIKWFWPLFQDHQVLFDVIKTSLIVSIITVLETIISGKAAERITKEAFSKDKEIFWNSLANIWSGLMWWLPVTAVFVRTSLNIKSWAQSKWSQLIAGLSVLLICLIVFNNMFTLLPMSIIAAILISIAISIINFSALKNFYTFKKTSFFVVLVTIVVSIFVDTVVGILVWTVVALLIFIKKTTKEQINVVIFNNRKFVLKTTLASYISQQKSHDTVIVKFAGQINYLNSENYYQQLIQISSCRNIVFSFSQASDIDFDWLEWLENSIDYFLARNTNVYLTGIGNERMKILADRLPVVEKLISENKIYVSTSELLSTIAY